jgi:polyhydroxyalkanoate synthase
VTKYGYRIDDNLEGDADAWFEKSTQHPGSWWPEWAR